jgi:hypothetical protein
LGASRGDRLPPIGKNAFASLVGLSTIASVVGSRVQESSNEERFPHALRLERISIGNWSKRKTRQ